MNPSDRKEPYRYRRLHARRFPRKVADYVKHRLAIEMAMALLKLAILLILSASVGIALALAYVAQAL